MSEFASFEYKCRRCSEVCAREQFPVRDAVHWLFYALYKMDVPSHLRDQLTQAPGMLSFHHCQDGGTGVADLIGYALVKPNETQEEKQ